MKKLRLTFGALALLQLAASGCGDSAPTVVVIPDAGITYEPGPTCIAFCDKTVGECGAFNFDEASCEQGCESDVADNDAISEACGEAVEAWFQCAAELDCAGVAGWITQEPPDSYPCRDEAIVGDLACGRI